MHPNNAVELKNVSKTFQIQLEKKRSVFEYLTGLVNRQNTSEEICALKDVTLSLKKGQILGVLGFNGSGKTTLLKIIAKIYSPDSGIINTDGKIIPFLGLGVGFNGELTARENIVLYAAILGLSKKEINEKMDEIIRFAELEKFIDAKLKKFSSGMNARLAFSTAMSVDPDILLVDEVLSVGDINFRSKSFDKLMEFKKRGKTIILVSHALNQIKNICDTAIWLHEGRVLQQGEPKRVVEEYYNFAHDKKPNYP